MTDFKLKITQEISSTPEQLQLPEETAKQTYERTARIMEWLLVNLSQTSKPQALLVTLKGSHPLYDKLEERFQSLPKKAKLATIEEDKETNEEAANMPSSMHIIFNALTKDKLREDANSQSTDAKHITDEINCDAFKFTSLDSERIHAELSQSDFDHNIDTVRSVLTSGTQLGFMTKGNAYGLGLKEQVLMSHDKADLYFAINVSSAFAIRALEEKLNLPLKRIIVHSDMHSGFFKGLSDKQVLECINQNIELTMCSRIWEPILTQLKKFKSSGKFTKKIPIHIFVDTGLNREGFPHNTLKESLAFLEPYLDLLEIKGVMSHFAVTYRPDDAPDPTLDQIQRYHSAYDYIQKTLAAAIPGKLEKCLANSHGVFCHPEAHFDIVRVGTAINDGLWPIKKTQATAESIYGKSLSLKPVLSLRTTLYKFRKLKQGETIHTHDECSDRFTVTRDSVIGIVPTDEYHYPRILPNTKPFVLIKGKQCPILFTELEAVLVDVTDVYNNEEALTVTLIGQDGEASVTASDIANWSTARSPLVVLVQIDERVPRHIVRGAPIVQPETQAVEVSELNNVFRNK